MQEATPEFGQSPLRRLLSTTWPLFRAFRIDVRISWTIAIWPLFFTFGFLKWMSFGEALLWGVAWTMALFTTVFTHEMGHIAMGRRLGIETERMTLRGLGGLAHLDGPAQTPRGEILISLAGPATHLVWIAVLYPLVWMLEGSFEDQTWFWMLEGFAFLNLWMMIFNLLPVYPMDGGRTLRGVMATRMHANKASYKVSTVGFVGNGIFILFGLLAWLKLWDPLGHGPYGFLLVWIGYEGIQANRRLRMQAKHGEIYADHDPFQKVLMELKAAMREMDSERDKERERREKAAAERAQVQATVDRILDRITELGGIDALPARERRELEKASKRLAKLD